MTIKVTNEQFLKTIFGDEWGKTHVTAFTDDPSCIETDSQRSRCWAGGAASDRLKNFTPDMNQYFTISLFNPEENTGRAVRRKANFDACFVIVADDVKEKLPLDRVELLPVPTYKLLSSEGSEQWAWVLSEACESRDQIENLLDGLVAKGLAPEGNDPGMKGVTRYVRLPEGSNTKKKRYVNGKPFSCQITEWNPEKSYDLDELAEVFDIDINQARGQADGAWANIDDPLVINHPIMRHLNVTGVGADGWIRVDCPNVAEHSDGDPSGAAVQIKPDGRVHFQCHHGHCSGEGKGKKLTGRKVIALLDEQLCQGDKSFIEECDHYQREQDAKLKLEQRDVLKKKLGVSVGALKKGSEDEANEQVGENLFDKNRYIFLAPENKFYDIKTGLSITPNGLDNRYLKQMPKGKGKMLASEAFLTWMDKQFSEADGVSWLPTGINAPSRSELIQDVENKRMINTWSGFALKPRAGDVSLWLNHVEYLIPDAREREVVLDYLACMVQRVSEKPAFFIGHRGTHRTGKDLLYKPVMQALGHRIARAVEIDNILSGWGDYLNEMKFVIVTEVDKAQDKRVANSMKTITAPTASGYRILNMKGKGVVTQLDCMGGVMMSNKRHFIAIEQGDKRYFIVDSWVEPNSKEYYKKIDDWYKSGEAYPAVLHYLLNRDLSGFDHNQLPYMTPGALEMVQAGKYDYEQDLEEMINDGLPPFHSAWVTSKEVKKVVKEQGLKCGNNGLEDALRALGWFKFRGQKKVEGEVISTPTFFTDRLDPDATKAEVCDFYEQNQREVTKLS